MLLRTRTLLFVLAYFYNIGYTHSTIKMLKKEKEKDVPDQRPGWLTAGRAAALFAVPVLPPSSISAVAGGWRLLALQ